LQFLASRRTDPVAEHCGLLFGKHFERAEQMLRFRISSLKADEKISMVASSIVRHKKHASGYSTEPFQ